MAKRKENSEKRYQVIASTITLAGRRNAQCGQNVLASDFEKGTLQGLERAGAVKCTDEAPTSKKSESTGGGPNEEPPGGG